MDRSVRFAVVCVGVSLLISCHSIEAWYKQSTGPSYYSVGRASGLLSGIRRSPYVRRSDSEDTQIDSGEVAGNNAISESNRQISILKSMVGTTEVLQTWFLFDGVRCVKTQTRERCRSERRQNWHQQVHFRLIRNKKNETIYDDSTPINHQTYFNVVSFFAAIKPKQSLKGLFR